MVGGRAGAVRRGVSVDGGADGASTRIRVGAKGSHLPLGVFVDEARVAREVLGRRSSGGDGAGVEGLTGGHDGGLFVERRGRWDVVNVYISGRARLGPPYML